MNKFKTHICRNCGTKQYKPENVFKWCIECFSPSVVTQSIMLRRACVEGYILIMQNISCATYDIGKYYLGTEIDFETVYMSAEFTRVCTFPTDNMAECDNKIFIAMEREGLIVNDCVDYIKTIDRYQDGKFYFKEHQNG